MESKRGPQSRGTAPQGAAHRVHNPLASLGADSKKEPASEEGAADYGIPAGMPHAESFHSWEIASGANAQQTFRTRIFVEQTLTHLFFPLSLTVYLWRHNIRAAQNQLFLPWGLRAKHFVLPIVEMLNYSMPWLAVSLFFLMGGVYQAEVWATVSLFVVRCLVVGTKYAFMEEDEYVSYLACMDPGRAKARVYEKQLVTGWLNPSKSLLAREVSAAGRTHGVDVQRMSISVSAAALPRVREYLGVVGAPFNALATAQSGDRFDGSEGGDVDMQPMVAPARHPSRPSVDLCEATGTVSLGALAVAVAVQARCRHATSMRATKWLIYTAAVIQSVVIPLGTRAAALGWRNTFAHVQQCLDEVTADPGATCTTSAGTVLLLFTFSFFRGLMFSITAAFLGVGVVDYQTRHRMLEEVGNLVRSMPTHDEARPEPFVDLSYPGNITPWIFLRNLLQDIGSQYRRRIQRYTGYGIIVVIGLTVWIALTAFTMPQRAIVEFLEPGEAQLLLFFAVFYSLVIITPLLLMILAGAAANDLSQYHASTLSRYELLFRERALWTGKRHSGRAQDVAAMLRCATQDLEARDKVRPIKFLSIRADTRLLYTMSTFAATLMSALARTLVNVPKTE